MSAEISYREVVVGRNSKIWGVLRKNPAVSARFKIALSHREVSDFSFGAADRIWIFSYSRLEEENSALLNRLVLVGARTVIYVSSASTIVERVTRCYEYPRVKLRAEREAQSKLNAGVLVLGLVFDRLEELPGGINCATSYAQLTEFLLEPKWTDVDGKRTNLFIRVDRPFSSALEESLYRCYGLLIGWTRSWPCLLRPLDYVLRLIGIRWYGYLHLSNRLWNTTTS